MGLLPPAARLPASGWRRTAALNTIFVGLLTTILAIILSVAIGKTKSINYVSTIFQGDCALSGRIDLLLHLLINILSTCVLASSNYFMQVLTSPTRQEVDAAHRKSKVADIGVPSTSNFRHVASFKTCLWLLFLLSSVPIHMLFNSAIFDVDYQGSDFRLTIATEAFVQGADYHSLGASLLPPGTSGLHPEYYLDEFTGFGDIVRIEDFSNSSSAVLKNISRVAAQARSWARLSLDNCIYQYRGTQSRREYGDVVLVVNSHLRNTTAQLSTANPTGLSTFNHDFGNPIFTDGSLPYWSLATVTFLVNIPQQILSLCYFSYNTFLTRFCVEREWRAYALGYKPLRVTNPRGMQVSTYRLQLPYKYSIPLLLVSILLHWLASSTLYIFVIDGGYVKRWYDGPDGGSSVYITMPGISDKVFVALGYSTLAIIVVLSISAVLASIPIILASLPLRGEMVLCGGNSAIISAACHAAPTRPPAQGYESSCPSTRPEETDTVDSQLLSSSRNAEGTGNVVDPGPTARETLQSAQSSDDSAQLPKSQQLVRWGVVGMPEAWYVQFADSPVVVEHLAFGTADDDVSEAQKGRSYA
ncbi:hypothetical protein GQ53DRAFT_823855 [Thozetella sp. PMI_491]|nr:hypothetical protein GQ53DRAFT_823855 [Thozetella sp. PMI_491]